MHTRRIAGFLLGAWLGGSALMLLIRAANDRFTSELLSTPSNQAQQFLKKTGFEADAAMLLHYQAVEQNRRYAESWELAQFGLGVLLAACLFLGTQRRVLPLALCGLMLVAVLFEHFALTPELALRGRGADFPPGNTSAQLLLRLNTLGQIYGWLETSKLALGGLLSSYLFVFRVRRTRKHGAFEHARASHAEG